MVMIDVVVDAGVVIEKEIVVVEVVDEDYLLMMGVVERLFDKYSRPLWYTSSVRL